MTDFKRSVQVSEVGFSQGHLEAILVPWDTPTRIVEMTADGVDDYMEGFRRSAFDRQLELGRHSSVVLLPRHDSTETFGQARHLEVRDEGLHAVLSVLPSRQRDVEQMVDDGIDSMSIEFHADQRRGRLAHDKSVRWRTEAFLDAVAMTPIPAYPDAKILALRDQDLDAIREANLARIDAVLEEVKDTRWKRTI